MTNRRSASYDSQRVKVPGSQYAQYNSAQDSSQSQNTQMRNVKPRMASDSVIYDKYSDLSYYKPPQTQYHSSGSNSERASFDSVYSSSASQSFRTPVSQEFNHGGGGGGTGSAASSVLPYPTSDLNTISPVPESPEAESSKQGGSSSPSKSMTNSFTSNAIGSIIGSYNYSQSSFGLERKSTSPELMKQTSSDSYTRIGSENSRSTMSHRRQSSDTSTLSNISSNEQQNKSKRFARYAMNTQADSVNQPRRWDIDSVISWLKEHQFNTSWQETFKNNEISGNRFLELENFDKNSMIWKQFSKYLKLDSDANSIERFIELLRHETENESSGKDASLLSAIAKNENRKSTPVFTKHKSSSSVTSINSAPFSTQRPVSFVDARSKEQHPSTSSHSLFRINKSVSNEGDARRKSSALDENKRLSKLDFTKNGRILNTIRKYGGDRAVGMVKASTGRQSNRNSTVSMNSTQSSEKQEFESLSPTLIPPRPTASRTSIDSANSGSSVPSFRIEKYDELPSPLDEEYMPQKFSQETAKTILLSRDNRSFIPYSLANDDVDDISLLRSKMISHLGMVDMGTITIHLTDFNATEGGALPDDLLYKILCQDSESMAKFVVRQDIGSPGTTIKTISTFSSDSKSFETSDEHRTYPETPQYLLQTTNVAKVDYLNFKEHANLSKISENPKSLSRGTQTDISIQHEQKTNEPEPFSNELSRNFDQLRRKSSLHNFPLKFPFRTNSKKKTPLLQIDTTGISSSRNSSISPESAGGSSFKVIRKSGNEINFDERRKSPFERKAPKLIANIYESSLSDYKSSPISATTVMTLRDDPKDSVLKKSVSQRSDLRATATATATAAAAAAASDSIKARRAAPPPPISVDKRSRILRDRNSALFNGHALHSPSSSISRDADADSDDDFFVKPMSRKGVLGDTRAHDKDEDEDENENENENEEEVASRHSEDTDSESDFFAKPMRRQRTLQMSVRPPVEDLYDNLEIYFPHTNLDKPIIDEETPAQPIKEKTPSISRTFSNANISPVNPEERESTSNARVRRMKTIRGVANEARRKALKQKQQSPPITFANISRENSKRLTRSNTKMWGQKVFEVTSREIEKGVVNKFQNKNGRYQEFAWIKGELIGRGSFGDVYLGLNVTTGEMLAVKQVVKSNKLDLEGIMALHKEVETMKDLDHKHIVQYLGYEQNNNTYSLFLEYVAGGSIAMCLKSYGRFDETLIRIITKQVLLGLEYLHSNNIIHRDLKADNLLLDIDGTCKISDFGISRKNNDIYSNANMSMKGTIFWMAPEVIDNMVEGYSAKVDIWSLGCVVLEMFAGKRPWSNEAAISVIYKAGKEKKAPPIPKDIAHLVSKEAENFINRCFVIDPALRPTAEELLNDPFVTTTREFNFASTELGRLIKINSKVYPM
ncbi:BCK1 [Candida theae]|uniref:mitogen-activated protein kinase kinase kinase n=1 Tax=Candida theae TaxID=1198502 RepID=A0AAD5G0D3_9ASCO|nr:BCK1 [Candida theae]KAI5965011.1 BCK1 [Candida theae]